MLICSNCNQEMNDDTKFCPNCGTPVKENSSEEKRKMVFEGTIHKCPNCGEILNSFVTNCPACGYEIRERKNSTSVSEFAAKLEEIEKSRPATNELGFKDIFTTAIVDDITQKEISMIQSFPIPNTKEDLIEFLILSSSNINTRAFSELSGTTARQKAISGAWKSKFEQAYQKALISFGSTPEFKNIQNIYDKINDELTKTNKSNSYFWIVFLVIMVIVIIGSICIVFNTSSKSSERREKQNTVTNVYAQNIIEN